LRAPRLLAMTDDWTRGLLPLTLDGLRAPQLSVITDPVVPDGKDTDESIFVIVSMASFRRRLIRSLMACLSWLGYAFSLSFPALVAATKALRPPSVKNNFLWSTYAKNSRATWENQGSEHDTVGSQWTSVCIPCYNDEALAWVGVAVGLDYTEMKFYWMHLWMCIQRKKRQNQLLTPDLHHAPWQCIWDNQYCHQCWTAWNVAQMAASIVALCWQYHLSCGGN